MSFLFSHSISCAFVSFISLWLIHWRTLDLTIRSSKPMIVRYVDAPGPPSILGYQEDTSIRAGSLQRLTCVVHGGNPLPELKWFKGDEEIKSGLTPSSNGNVVSNELAVVTKDSDNGAMYRCEASSTATGDTPLVASIRLTVHCEFADYERRPCLAALFLHCLPTSYLILHQLLCLLLFSLHSSLSASSRRRCSIFFSLSPAIAHG